MLEPVLELPHSKIVNLLWDPKEREPRHPRYLSTWTWYHFGRLLAEYRASVEREPPIPAGAPVDCVPRGGG